MEENKIELRKPPNISVKKSKDNVDRALITEIYLTLKANKKKVREINKNAVKTLEKKPKVKTNAEYGNPNGKSAILSESVNLPKNSTPIKKAYQTMDPRRSKSPKYNTTTKTPTFVSQITPEVNRNSSKKIGNGKSFDKNEKLRTIIFRTIDRFFHISPAPSKIGSTATETLNEGQRQDNKIGLNTLKRLSAYETDTLPREQTVNIENGKDDKNSGGKSVNRSSLLLQDASFSSEESGDKSWIYVDNILDVQNAEQWDLSENSTIPAPSEDFDEPKLLFKENLSVPVKRAHYKKKESKTSKNKIKKRLEERKQIVHSPYSPMPEINQKETTPKRPDSPIRNKISLTKTQPLALSLPNLIEQSYTDSDDSILLCGANTFKREAEKRPSSTLKKELDNDSTKFGDNTFQVSNSDLLGTHVLALNETTRPSALCSNVQVQPINVPIVPMKDSQVQIISKDELKRLYGMPQTITISGTGETRNYNNAQDFIKEEEKCLDLLNTAAEVISQDDGINVVKEVFNWLQDADEDTEVVKINSPILEKVKDDTPPQPLSFPPPPPPMPTLESHNKNVTVRGLLPLTVFTEPQSGKNIFIDMKGVELTEDYAKNLKKKFPLRKSCGKQSIRLRGDNQGSSLPEAFKLKLNTELFLKTYNIDNFDPLLESIETMNIGNCKVNKDCWVALSQILLKSPPVEATSFDRNENVTNVDNTEKFLQGLSKISRLNEKLTCIQFGLDFSEFSTQLSNRINSFIKTCEAFSTSPKFIKIIEVIMAFLECMGSEGVGKIYGFDIQSLNKLASKVSVEDESTTLLHFLVDYIMHNPGRCDAANFYLEFKDLSDVSKISLNELEKQVVFWDKNVASYKKEIDLLDCKDFANSTYEEMKVSLESLSGQLVRARQSFLSCKERYGLLGTAEILENTFFESISNFIASFRKIHIEIIQRELARKRRSSMENSRIPLRRTENKLSGMKSGNIPNKRQSCGPAFFRNLTSSPPKLEPPVDELTECLQSMLNKGNQRKRVKSKPNQQP